jgi:hypothetical protein
MNASEIKSVGIKSAGIPTMGIPGIYILGVVQSSCADRARVQTVSCIMVGGRASWYGGTGVLDHGKMSCIMVWGVQEVVQHGKCSLGFKPIIEYLLL